jgi:hypothetical protein
VKSAPAGDNGNAVERMQDAQCHILELLDTYARYRRDPDRRAAEAARLASLISTLLRVHCELEAMMLQAQLSSEAGSGEALAPADAQRDAVLEALDRAEAHSPRDAQHRQAMAVLAERVRTWFQDDEQQLFALARRSQLDLVALDRDMAAPQEALLSAGGARATRTGVARESRSTVG